MAVPAGMMGGGPPQGGPSGEEILAAIAQLLQQYLAVGEDTPVKAEAEQFMAAIQPALEGEAPAPGEGGEEEPLPGGDDPAIEEEATDFASARRRAMRDTDEGGLNKLGDARLADQERRKKRSRPE